MICDQPIFVQRAKWSSERIPLPCGKCPPCKIRRVNQWVFRLMQEEKSCYSAHFVTLTYDTRFVPITQNGFMTLVKRDYQLFMKRLRKLCPGFQLKYYAVGEYGTKNRRPHFHAIIFNCPSSSLFFDAWGKDGVQFGTIHVGTVTSDSIAYCMKYIDKASFRKLHARDDRQPEFSLSSQNLGVGYLTDEVIKYHRSDPGRLYVTKVGGHKVSMPRIYREKIWTEQERKAQIDLVRTAVELHQQSARIRFEMENTNPEWSWDKAMSSAKQARNNAFYSPNKKQRNL